MNAFARHYVGQGNTRGQHSHPHFAILRLGALFFNQPKCIGPAVVSDYYTRVSHGALTRLLGTRPCGASLEIRSASRRGPSAPRTVAGILDPGQSPPLILPLLDSSNGRL